MKQSGCHGTHSARLACGRRMITVTSIAIILIIMYSYRIKQSEWRATHSARPACRRRIIIIIIIIIIIVIIIIIIIIEDVLYYYCYHYNYYYRTKQNESRGRHSARPACRRLRSSWSAPNPILIHISINRSLYIDLSISISSYYYQTEWMTCDTFSASCLPKTAMSIEWDRPNPVLIHVSLSLSLYICISMFLYICIYLSICISICLSVYLYTEG